MALNKGMTTYKVVKGHKMFDDVSLIVYVETHEYVHKDNLPVDLNFNDSVVLTSKF